MLARHARALTAKFNIFHVKTQFSPKGCQAFCQAALMSAQSRAARKAKTTAKA
jgi:hypothetical protein